MMRKMLRRFGRIVFKNSSRIYLDRFNRAFAAEITPDMYVLDAGAGIAQYRNIFNHAHYETADFEQVDKEYTPSTYVCDLATIPVENERFDRVVCNQVLEHLSEPLIVLKELNRVLKPEGRMILSTPLYYEEHEQPYDFYRYTQFAHRFLFQKAGFEIESIDWLEGYFGTMAYQFRGMAMACPLRPTAERPVVSTLLLPVLLVVKVSAILLSALFYRLDLVWKVTDRGYPKNYVVVARKNGEPPR